MQKRLAEIAARKAEMKKEMQTADEKRIAELNTEADALIVEEQEIRKKLDLGGKLGAPEAKPGERREGESDIEKRARELRETRAVTIGSGTLVQPKQVSGVNGVNNEVSSIVDLVKVVPAQGMGSYQVAYQTASATAGKNAENVDAAESDATFAYADITPITLTTYSEISRESLKLTNLDYFSRVRDSAMAALRKKVSEFIIKSDAATSAKFIGILDASALVTAHDVTITAIAADTLRKIAFNYGGDENIMGNAILLLSKKDLIAFGDVRGTNEKKAVYEITPDSANPNTGIIKDGGLSVQYVINSNLSETASASAGDYTMIYGVPTCYELALFSDYAITVSEDAAFKRRMLAVLGEVMVGGNVTVYDGFIRVKKGA